MTYAEIKSEIARLQSKVEAMMAAPLNSPDAPITRKEFLDVMANLYQVSSLLTTAIATLADRLKSLEDEVKSI